MLARLALSVLTFAAALSAQQNILWVNNGNAGTGGGNAFPWGSNGIRYQTIVNGTLFPPGPAMINDIFVAGAPNGSDLDIDYTDIEILMGTTPLATPVAVWASNNPNPTVVYRGPLRVYFERAGWRGIGLPAPYLFLPTAAEPNLCVEIIVWGTSTGTGNFYFPETDATVNRAFRFEWTTNQAQTPLTGAGGGSKIGLLLWDGNFVEAGTGCSGATTGPLRFGANTYPQSGQTIDLTLSGAAPNTAAFLALGTSFTTFGGLPLPVDLGLLGAPGCWLWNDPAVVIGVATSPTGNASLTLPVPRPTGFARLYGTWGNLDVNANQLGITTSSNGKLILGS